MKKETELLKQMQETKDQYMNVRYSIEDLNKEIMQINEYLGKIEVRVVNIETRLQDIVLRIETLKIELAPIFKTFNILSGLLITAVFTALLALIGLSR